MKNCRFISLSLIIVTLSYFVIGQTIDAFEDETEKEKTVKSLLDPSKFLINHSVSFGMSSSSQWSGLKSQSLYTTMMTYKVSEPVTLNLNFSLPIHSSFSSSMNLNHENIESLEYFKSMPFDASVIWSPSENLHMKFTIGRSPSAPSLFSPFHYQSIAGYPFFRDSDEER